MKIISGRGMIVEERVRDLLDMPILLILVSSVVTPILLKKEYPKIEFIRCNGNE